MPFVNLDPPARAQLETLAAAWRDVHPGGGLYAWDVLGLLESEKRAGRIGGDEASLLLMRVSRYSTHQTETLDLSQ